jgi:hypothetical protein
MSKIIFSRKISLVAMFFVFLTTVQSTVSFAASDNRPSTFDKVPTYTVYHHDLDFAIGIPIDGIINLISEGSNAFKWRFKSVGVYGPGWTYGGIFHNYVKTECDFFTNAGIKLNDPIYGPQSVSNMKIPLLVSRHTKDKSNKFSGTGYFLPKFLKLSDELKNKLLEVLSVDLVATPLPDQTKIFALIEKDNLKMFYISVQKAEFKDGKGGGGGWLLQMTGDKIKIIRSDRAPFGVMLQSWADVDGNGAPEIFLFEAIGAKVSDLAALLFLAEKNKWYRLAGIAPCQ